MDTLHRVRGATTTAARLPAAYRDDGSGPFSINDASAVIGCDPSWHTTWSRMRADTRALRDHWDEPIVRRLYPSLFIVWSHRIAHTLHVRGSRAVAMLVMWACHALTGCEIRPGAIIGPGLMVVHPSGIVIGGGSIIGERLQLYGSNCLGSNMRDGTHGSPRLGDDVTLGTHAIVLGPTVVGDRVVVGAGSVVLHDVAEGAKVKGTPAR